MEGMSEVQVVPSRRPARPVDWRLAAQLLAEGNSTTEVATVMGCSRQTVWRILRRSQALRARTAELRRRDMAETGARLLGLRVMVVETIHQAIADGDKQMARWLADRLGIHRFGFLETVAAEGEAGADQLESEAVLDKANAALDVATAAKIVEAAEHDATVAATPVAATCLPDQGDSPVTDATGNTLSHPFQIVTRNAVWPPPGVFAE